MMGLKGEGNVREKQAKIVTGAGPESTRKGWRSFGVDISSCQKNNDAMVVFFLFDVGTLFGSPGRNKRT
jgi:hypothetical protein